MKRIKIERTERNSVGVSLSSGCSEWPGCKLILRGFGWYVTVRLPQWVLRPIRQFRDLSAHVGKEGYSFLKPNADGSYGYHEVFEREYGFHYSERALHARYGKQMMAWPGCKSKCIFLPWLESRFIRLSFYDLQGRHFFTEWESARRGPMRDAWEAQRAVKDACPKAAFLIDDYDGKRITATTHIEEREWRHGTGWFRWLSLFRRPFIRRALSIEFSAEVGPEKGSWKGGTMGTGIDMLPGELHEAAFKRFCEEDHRARHSKRYRVTYVGPAAKPAPVADENVATGAP
jgi:hypothetical protein